MTPEEKAFFDAYVERHRSEYSWTQFWLVVGPVAAINVLILILILVKVI